jgi:hypothetical protein
MSMGYCRLSLAAVATLSLLIAVKPEPVSAGSALALAMMQAGAEATAGATHMRSRVGIHSRRSQSYYCYPRNLWWFYRPYTTAQDGHPRCMPYFHYLEPYGQRGAKPGRYVK